MRGNITRRGKFSWRIKFDAGTEGGKRVTRYVTVRGTRKGAEVELSRLLNDAHKGTLVDPSKITVAAYLRSWLDGQTDLSPVSVERYRDIIERQTIPIIGAIELQKLKPIHVRDWVSGMLKRGGCRGAGTLSARSVNHALRVIRTALGAAVKVELLSRNVAAAVDAPKVEADEVEILTAHQIAAVLDALEGSRLYPFAALALATGCRRGELCALRWSDVGAGVVKVERSLEQTRAGLRFKGPKSKNGRRSISLPPFAVSMLDAHRREQLELRMKLGMGKPKPDALVFCDHDGKPIAPNHLSVMWRRAIAGLDVPKVKFHALRHSHASALIAEGVDLVTVSKRLGHASANFTLSVYAHLFRKTDDTAAAAIEKVMG
jgi:integrase